MSFSPARIHSRQTRKVVAYLMALTLGLGLSFGGIKAREGWSLPHAPAPVVMQMVRIAHMACVRAVAARQVVAAKAPPRAQSNPAVFVAVRTPAPLARALWARPPPAAGAEVRA